MLGNSGELINAKTCHNYNKFLVMGLLKLRSKSIVVTFLFTVNYLDFSGMLEYKTL